MTQIRVLSGRHRYGDPWHPFADTSRAVAVILTGAGHEVEVVHDSTPDCLTGLDAIDLVVVNLGGNPLVELAPDAQWDAAHRQFGAWMRAGGRVLALHTAANAFPDWADWPSLLGGQWVRGRSFHPDQDLARFEPHPDARQHPVWRGLDAVTAHDERYSSLTVNPSSTPLVGHQEAGRFEVMGWARGRRVLYDGMGHDASSYDSPTRAELLVNEAAWLLSAPATDPVGVHD